MIRRLATALWLVALPLRADVYPALHDVSGVGADDVLNIREQPDAKSSIIGTLAADASGVEVIAVSGGWALVNTDEGSGYVALRYLTRSAAADWNALQYPVSCLGTEPFWSLDVDPVAGIIRFQTPEDEEPLLSPIAQTWPALPWAPSVAVALSDGMVVLAPADCSDGMSDRRYGISADIFLQDGDRQRLSGCCRIAAP